MMSKRVLIMSVIPVELFNLLDALRIPIRNKKPFAESYYYWETTQSSAAGGQLEVLVCASGRAGNLDMAVLAANAIRELRPDFAILLGIAGGIRGKTKIGQTIFGDKIVHYEPAALIADANGERQEARPDMTDLDVGVGQMLTAYQADKEALVRIGRDALFQRRDALKPELLARPDVMENVADEPYVNFAAVASGEKLLRDVNKICGFRRDIHGRIEVVEMEAAGFVTACRHSRLPFMVVRGISDFGDDLKDDAFHGYAAGRVAVVAVDFLGHGLDFALLPQSRNEPAAAANDSTPKPSSSSGLTSNFDPDAAGTLQSFKNGQAALDDSCVCAFISVSPSRAGHPRNAAECYHLGHAVAAQLFSEFQESLSSLELLITPSSNYWRPSDGDQNKANFEILGNWFSAFEYRLEPTLIQRYIYNIAFDGRLSQLHGEIQNLWIFAEQRVVGSLAEEIRNWRYKETISDQARGAVLERFMNYGNFDGKIDLTAPEIFTEFLAFLYLTVSWPQWASADWIIKFTHCLTDPERSIVTRHFGKTRMLILESRKNRIVWDALAFVARMGGKSAAFPQRIYFPTLKNRSLNDWMYSRNPEGVVPLWGAVSDNVSALSDRFVEHALGLLQPTLQTDIPAGREWLSTFAVSWGQRLRQRVEA
jgi:nucleoside phosphorylase